MPARNKKERVVLVVGACGLDRVLSVKKYPEADAKIRTTAYHETGGGNAANSAAAIGRLTDASFLLKDRTRIGVRYLGKVGQDELGQKLLKELNDSNVDTSSPLCLLGPPGSTTSFTTVIVSDEEHTRTCIHTPGSCGELTVEDCQHVSLVPDRMDSVFKNVVHLHSDTRHASAALFLAQQAKQRGITVSCDCEKDRHDTDLDELLKISDIVFTNSSYLGDYLDRLTRQLEQKLDVPPLKTPHVQPATRLMMDEHAIGTIANSLIPSAFLARWYPLLGRQVIVTHGSMGALHFTLNQVKLNDEERYSPENTIIISRKETDGTDSTLCINHRHDQLPRQTIDDNGRSQFYSTQETEYLIQPSGVLSNIKIVDTTGAGDAFIGGYLLALLSINDKEQRHDHDHDHCPQETSSYPSSPAAQVEVVVQPTVFAMNFGSWVAGKKLQGPGARDALPRGNDVDGELGSTTEEIDEKLRTTICLFPAAATTTGSSY